MFGLCRKSVNFLAALFLFSSSFALIAPAQDIEKMTGEIEVPAVERSGSRYYRCFLENEVLYKERLEKIKTDPYIKDCPLVKQLPEVDFNKQSLISFITRGDCFLLGTAKVFRNDEAKKYTVRIKNIWGGCRAAGSFQGWLVIDKIPSDYKVDFVETRVDGSKAQIADDERFLPLPKKDIEPLESRRIDIKGCIQTYFQKQYVIKDMDAYLKAVRHDMGRERCLKDVEKIDFSKYSLLGIEVNSGYCGVPIGLKTQATKDDVKKQYLLNISYIPPQYGGCRAMSQYDVWTLVPKLPEGYKAIFNVKAELEIIRQKIALGMKT